MVHHCKYTDEYPSRVLVSIDKYDGNRLIIDNYGKESYMPKGEWRQNVAEYEFKNGKYNKIECHEEHFDENQYFRYSGKIFKKCTRKWRFRK